MIWLKVFPFFLVHRAGAVWNPRGVPGRLRSPHAGGIYPLEPIRLFSFHHGLFSRKSRRYWEGVTPSFFLNTLVNTR